MMKLFLMGNIIQEWIDKLIKALNDYVVEPIIGSILNMVGSILNMVWALLCNIIYGLISIFFDVLTTIPRLNLLENIGIEGIYQRVTLIIVIIMTFYITFEVVKYVVQPDTVTDKEKGAGNLAYRLIIVILLIAFVPKIFSIAYDLQGKIISSNVIGKMIFGANEKIPDSLGGEFAANTFSIFYEVNDAICNENTKWVNDGGLCPVIEDTVELNLSLIRNNWSSDFNFGGNVISALTLESYLSSQGVPTDDRNGNSLQPMIKFQGLLAIIVGIYILWTLIVYGVEVARRYFQLIFLQITAPIAIISYVSPKKDGAFQKWVRQCTTTYLDLFIRLAILYFILLIMNVLHDSIFSGSIFDKSLDISMTSGRLAMYNAVVPWVYIFLIIGLLQFLKKAPKLLKELLPSGNAASGEFGMSGKEMLGTAKQVVSGTGRAVGGVVGGFRGAKTAINSKTLKGGDKVFTALNAGFQGAKAGFSKGGGIGKASEAGRNAVYKAEDIALAGGDVLGATFQGNKYAQEAKGYERKQKHLEEVAKVKGDGKNLGSGHGMMKQAASTVEDLGRRGIANPDAIGAWNKTMEKTLSDVSVSKNISDAKRSITNATHELYETERQNIQDKARIDAKVTQQTLDDARNQHQSAVQTLSYYETFVGQLTESQKAEHKNAQKAKDETEAQIKNAEEKLRTIEENKQKDLEISMREEDQLTKSMISKLVETTTDSTGNVIETLADADILTQMENVYTQGLNEFKESDIEYKTPDGKPIKVMSDAEELAEARRRAAVTGNSEEIELAEVKKENLRTYVKNIGKIEDSAKTEISNMLQDKNIKRAKANAEASGKSGK